MGRSSLTRRPLGPFLRRIVGIVRTPWCFVDPLGRLNLSDGAVLRCLLDAGFQDAHVEEDP